MPSPEKNFVLNEETRLDMTRRLHAEGLFGIHEDPAQIKNPLKSGRLSPHYLDIRPGITPYGFRKYLATNMATLADMKARDSGSSSAREAYGHVAGTPEAMTSYAATLADLLMMNLLQPRVATSKASGNKAPILGRYQPGQTVAEFDDVVTDGQSKIDTIEGFRAVDLEVKDYFVVLDREEGGAPHVEEVSGITITPALGVSSMVRMMAAEKMISQKQYDNVARYLDEYGEPHAQEAMNSAL
jgi:orotate phosphoribosyltransferase